MVLTLCLLLAISLALSVFITPLVRNLALRYGLVDEPDGHRKIHKEPIPRVGGIAILLACIGSCSTVALLSSFNVVPAHAFATTILIAPAAGIIFFIGLADDLFHLSAIQKLAGQTTAAVIVVLAGLRIRDLPFLNAHPVIAIGGTVVWLLICTNSVNLIDGMDGLASGIAALAATTTLVASLISGPPDLAVAIAPLVGALIGFLVFNFNPASIFLGDCGSLVLGFLLGCYSVLWCQKSATLVGMTAPVMALAVPLLDTSLAVARRFLRAKPIFSPDRSHIHHKLLARGLTQRHAVLLIYLAAAIAGSLSLCLIWARSHSEAFILFVFTGATLYGIRLFGYAEFETAGRLLTSGGLQKEINARIAVQDFEAMLRAAASTEECWTVIQEACGEFGFHVAHMQCAGRLLAGRNGPLGPGGWALRIPFSSGDWVELCHDRTISSHSTAVVSFAHTIHAVLSARSEAAVPRRSEEPALSGMNLEMFAEAVAAGEYLAAVHGLAHD